jgi:hypothetical protein
MFNIYIFTYFKVFSAVCKAADELRTWFVEFKNNLFQNSVTPVCVFMPFQ